MRLPLLLLALVSCVAAHGFVPDEGQAERHQNLLTGLNRILEQLPNPSGSNEADDDVNNFGKSIWGGRGGRPGGWPRPPKGGPRPTRKPIPGPKPTTKAPRPTVPTGSQVTKTPFVGVLIQGVKKVGKSIFRMITSPSGSPVREIITHVVTELGVQYLRQWLNPTTEALMGEDFVSGPEGSPYPPANLNEGAGGAYPNYPSQDGAQGFFQY